MTDQPLLDVSDVHRRFGGVRAIDGVSVAVEAGTVFGVIGPNGAGKTTLVNLVSGHDVADSGRIRLGSDDLTGRRVHQVAGLGVARTFQNIRLYRQLSAVDNVVVGSHLHRRSDVLASLVPAGPSRRARVAQARDILAQVGLDPARMGDRPAGTLPYGDQRRLEIARAVAQRPRLLILDEPAAGMNPVEKQQLRHLLEELVGGGGLTIVLIEHDVRLVMQLCRRIAVLNFGRKIAEGTAGEVAEDPAVISAYLGTRAVSEGAVSTVAAGAVTGTAGGEGVAGTPPPGTAPDEREPDRPRLGPSGPPLLEVRDLEVSYGAVRAVQGVSFQVAKGEVVALIGANGAGKSTILRTLSGLVRATAGRARFDGHDLLTRRPAAIVRAGLVQVPEGREILGRLTVRENLVLGGWQRRDKRAVARDVDAHLERFPILGQRADLAAGQLSGGEQQVLAVVRALVARPRLLLLDEPSLGLAPQLAENIFDLVESINGEGITVLLVEQNAYRALELADHAWVVETGRVAMSGTGRELLEDDRVRATYLGVDTR